MATIDLGKLKFNWRGVWTNTATYETDDVVFRNGHSYVARANFTAAQPAPEENNDWDLMSQGINYREAYNAATTYYLNDVVLYGSTLYILNDITEDDEQTGIDPPGGNWSVFLPQAAADVLHAPGDMVYRNNEDNAARLVVTEREFGTIRTVEEPRETYGSREFTYELNGTFGNTILTAASVPAVTYNITLENVRNDHFVLTGEDRNGRIFEKQDYALTVNIGDTIVFDATNTTADHPLVIRQTSATGADVNTGTYTGGGTATVTWVTTGVAAGTYFYACDNHEAAMGSTITVVDPTNRQGAADANGVIDVSRGQTYTITIDNATDQVTYNLFAGAAAQQTGAANALTADEGNSGGVQYTTGNPVTITFTPNQTTPDIVHITSQANTADNVTINVHDLTWAPSWLDQREALVTGRLSSVNRATVANTWLIRDLNTIEYNEDTLVALGANNSVEIAAGTYYVRAQTNLHDTGYCTSQLRDIAPATPVIVDWSYHGYNHPSYPSDVPLPIEGVYTFENNAALQLRSIAAVASGLGYTKVGAASMDQDNAPYTHLFIRRIS